MGLFWQWVLVTALVGLPLAIHAEDASALLGRISSASIENSLDDVAIKPWHVRVKFQKFDDAGKLVEQGTMEEWWAAPKLYKLVYTSPPYTATEIQNQDGLFRTHGATALPFVLQALQRAVVHPMPSEAELAGVKPKLQRKTFGKAELDCIMLNQPIKDSPEIPLGLFPTYCLENNNLRLSYDTGMLEVIRNRLGLFQQRTVALDLFISDGGKKLLSAQVDILQTNTVGTKFDSVSDMERVLPPSKIPPPTEMDKISGPQPVYPLDRSGAHISGVVLIDAVIGVDGHVSDLKIASTPTGKLAVSALEAVHQWVFKPYVVNGVPTPVPTKIEVHFMPQPH